MFRLPPDVVCLLQVMSHMRSPSQFPWACDLAIFIMTCMYGLLGAVAYWSRGNSVQDILVFSMGPTKPAWVAPAAAGCILIQVGGMGMCVHGGGVDHWVPPGESSKVHCSTDSPPPHRPWPCTWST